VAAHWAKNPQIVLPWTNPEKLLEASNIFGTSFAERKSIKGSQRTITQAIKTMNLEIDHSAFQVKNYLGETYGKTEAIAYYESMGIENRGGKYRLPIDSEARLYSLKQLLRGVEEHGLSDRKFGKAYWTEMLDRFTELKRQAENADRTTSEQVSIKTEQRKYIYKTLNSLIHMIKAYYPDNWKEELRIWGFLKEKY
jgi:hypothetical protein